MSSYNPLSLVLLPWHYRELVLPLARRRILSRYRGSVLGVLWAVLNPLFMLAIYTFIFSVVFQAKWGADPGSRSGFALFLFSGLILYSVFSECVNEAPSLLITNKLYIRQLVFPTEVLAWISVLGSLFHLVVNWMILTLFYSVVIGAPSFSVLYLPLTAIPIVLLSLGAVWFISSIGIYLRDLGHVVGLLTTALLFLSPIFYPASAVPAAFRAYYSFNPFVHILENSRMVLLHGSPPAWESLIISILGSWLFAWLGYIWFMKAKKGFSDVI